MGGRGAAQRGCRAGSTDRVPSHSAILLCKSILTRGRVFYSVCVTGEEGGGVWCSVVVPRLAPVHNPRILSPLINNPPHVLHSLATSYVFFVIRNWPPAAPKIVTVLKFIATVHIIVPCHHIPRHAYLVHVLPRPLPPFPPPTPPPSPPSCLATRALLCFQQRRRDCQRRRRFRTRSLRRQPACHH